MRYTYRVSAAETLSFQAAYAREFGKKIVPRWVSEVFSTVLLAVIFLVGLWLTEALDRAIALTCIVWLIQWVSRKSSVLVYRRLAARYVSKLPGGEI